jgi:hypothetical protein
LEEAMPDRQHAASNATRGVPFMPFPALNPFNWGALSSTHLMMSGIEGARASLDAWRAVLDAYRNALREQQNLVLTSAESRLAQIGGSGAGAGEKRKAAGDLLSPAFAAAKAIARANDVILEAQREALRAFVGSAEEHPKKKAA